MTSETSTVDRRYSALQYYVAIIAYLQQVLCVKDLFWNLSKFYNWHIPFYWIKGYKSKMYTGVCVRCKALLYFFLLNKVNGSVMVTFIQKHNK